MYLCVLWRRVLTYRRIDVLTGVSNEFNQQENYCFKSGNHSPLHFYYGGRGLLVYFEFPERHF